MYFADAVDAVTSTTAKAMNAAFNLASGQALKEKNGLGTQHLYDTQKCQLTPTGTIATIASTTAGILTCLPAINDGSIPKYVLPLAIASLFFLTAQASALYQVSDAKRKAANGPSAP